jgi:hypothetical protein
MMTATHPLYHLLYGDAGEEWPRWLGHLPWDVRAAYKRIVVEARQDQREGRGEATKCAACCGIGFAPYIGGDDDGAACWRCKGSGFEAGA